MIKTKTGTLVARPVFVFTIDLFDIKAFNVFNFQIILFNVNFYAGVRSFEK